MPTPYDLDRVMKAVADSPTVQEQLSEKLSGITRAAQQVITGVDHASISMLLPNGDITTVAPTDPLAVRSDDLQYEHREGPCVHAATTGENVDSADIAVDDRWPTYGALASELGVVSQQAFALDGDGQRWGALNLYSFSEGTYDDVSRETALLLASNAAVLLGLHSKVESLAHALSTRTTIGTAIGVVMGQYGLDADRAFAFLVRVSQEANVKLRVIARQIVDQANERTEIGG